MTNKSDTHSGNTCRIVTLTNSLAVCLLHYLSLCNTRLSVCYPIYRDRVSVCLSVTTYIVADYPAICIYTVNHVGFSGCTLQHISCRVPWLPDAAYLVSDFLVTCYTINKYYTFIAKFGEKKKPSGDMHFLGWTNLHVSRLTGQLVLYYTDSWSSTYYRGNMHWIEVLQIFAFHSMWVRRGAQNLYYDFKALAAAAQCRETWQGRHGVWRETRRFVFPPRDFSTPIIFLYSSYQVHEV